MTPDSTLRAFAAFLTSAWQASHRLLSHPTRADELMGDWLQANWEILVEATLLGEGSGFLEVYGDGADCNGASSRVFRPSALPTHRIVCYPTTGTKLRDLVADHKVEPRDVSFWGFVQWDGRTYDPTPEFNAVLLEGFENIVVALDEVELALEEI